MVPAFGGAAVGLPAILRRARRWRAEVAAVAVALVLAAALVAPAAGTLWSFWRKQSEGLFGGGDAVYWLLGGLTRLRSQPGAFWALGGETFARPRTPAGRGISWILTGLALLGLASLARRRQWGMAVVISVTVLVAAGWIHFLGNPYVPFKMLTMVWWCLAGAVVVGGAWLLEWTPLGATRRAAARVAVFAAVAWGAAMVPGWVPLSNRQYACASLPEFRRVRDVPARFGQGPIVLAVNEWLACELAAFYLQGSPLVVITPQGWFWDQAVRRYRDAYPAPTRSGFLVLLERRREAAEYARLVEGGRRVWIGDVFELWQVPPPATGAARLVHTEPMRGSDVEQSGRHGLLVGRHGVSLAVAVRDAGILELGADLQPHGLSASAPIWLRVEAPQAGPARTRAFRGYNHVRQAVSRGYLATTAASPGRCTFRVPVNAGLNRILLSCPGLPVPPPFGAEADPPGVAVFDLTLRLRQECGSRRPDPAALAGAGRSP